MENLCGWSRDLDWGSLPDWLAATGTIAAVVVALLVAFKQHALLTGQNQQLETTNRKLESRARRAQARSVSWQYGGAERTKYDRTLQRTDKENVQGIWVFNGSDAPIYRVRAHESIFGPASDSAMSSEIPVIDAGVRAFILLPFHIPPSDASESVIFSDGHEVRWARYRTGELDEVAGSIA